MILHGPFVFGRTNTGSWVYSWLVEENVLLGSQLTMLNTYPCCPHLFSCLAPDTFTVIHPSHQRDYSYSYFRIGGHNDPNIHLAPKSPLQAELEEL